MGIFPWVLCGYHFWNHREHRGGIASNKIDGYLSLCSLWLPFLKTQRAQRWHCIRQVLQILFSVFSVVTFFETTEYTEGELHQTRSTNIFLCVLRGYLFWNHRVHRGGITSNKINKYFLLCSLWFSFLKPQRAQRWNRIRQYLQIIFSVLSVVIFLKPQSSQRWNYSKSGLYQ